jgi:hypothetical protein
VRSRAEHEALGDGNRHGESTDLLPGITGPMGGTMDSYPTESDRRLLVVSAIWMGGERKRGAERRRRLNIVRCEQ